GVAIPTTNFGAHHAVRGVRQIADRIIHDLGRGCTILDGEGGYSRKPVKVVVLLAKKSESVSIFRIVKRIDHQAFISQSIVRGVYGEGFDQIKT
ncbi:MAG: YitT family protein, partial [Parabacteroides sp.]|nr:YitT family protein [Parabacteroides sp.]